jgi:hypothetical protein
MICKSCGWEDLPIRSFFSFPCGEPICNRCMVILPHLGKAMVDFLFGRMRHA